ncbi:nitrate reductase cytochrome c-type subunit [Thiolapillus brandeum]|nr:nitrate reductase cytochrome c-type subunit [Thiolapillus brandeum]
MKKINVALAFGVLSVSIQATPLFAETVQSLRGDIPVEKPAEIPPVPRTMAVDGGIDVNYEDQPPLIPHSIDKTRITLNQNSCLSCHSREYSKTENAVRPPKSHYKTRDGKKLKQISTGRYFCTQCHVPQAYTKPLVQNDFKSQPE